MARVESFIETMLYWRLSELASVRGSDAMAIYGPMHSDLPSLVRDGVESIDNRNEKLTILLDTGGGLVDSVEKTVEVLRHHYKCVDFIIPGQAMSAGTVFALSADDIYMNYFSQLGPIDPQFFVDGKWVPVLGYLEKFEELNEKSKRGTITPLEYGLVIKLDLADIHRYEQAREHSVELLKKWLPAFKFKNWDRTQSRKVPVTPAKKKKRAEEIAVELNNTKRWHAHSRGISMQTLQNEIGLKIKDFDKEAPPEFGKIVNELHAFIVDYVETAQKFSLVRIAQSKQPMEGHEQD